MIAAAWPLFVGGLLLLGAALFLGAEAGREPR